MNSQVYGIIGQFGPAQLACMRSWRRLGYRTVFFQLGGRKVPALLARFVDTYHFYPSETCLQEVLPDISRQCDALGVTAITTLSESHAKLLDDFQQAGGLAGTRCMLNPASVYQVLDSKLAQADIAARAGLPVMPTYFIDADNSNLADTARPLVLRPDVPQLVTPPFKVNMVQSRAAALQFAGTLNRTGFKLIAQTLVTGPNLVIHAARAADGSWDHHEAFVTEIKFGGLAVSLRPWAMTETLLRACRKFEQEVGLRGVFHYDFILDEASNVPYFLEVNPRLGGTTAKVFAAGYDEPAMLVAAFTQTGQHRIALGGNRRASTSRLAMLRFAVSAVREKPSMLDFPHSRGIGMFARIAWSLLTYRDELITLSDPMGNLAWLMQAKS